MGHQAGGIARSDAQQELAARDQQLVAELEGFGEIRFGHADDVTTPR